jgi:hypothetical protein
MAGPLRTSGAQGQTAQRCCNHTSSPWCWLRNARAPSHFLSLTHMPSDTHAPNTWFSLSNAAMVATSFTQVLSRRTAGQLRATGAEGQTPGGIATMLAGPGVGCTMCVPVPSPLFLCDHAPCTPSITKRRHAAISHIFIRRCSAAARLGRCVQPAQRAKLPAALPPC